MSDETIAPVAEPAADLIVTIGKKRIKRLYGGTSSTDMFFDGSAAPVGKDVKSHPWFPVFLKWNGTSISHGNGGFSKDYGIAEGGAKENDYLYIGGPGKGWYAIPPVDCEDKQGELCGDYRVGGKNLDFWGSHMLLRDMMGAENYIIGNMLKAPIEHLYHQIEATFPQKAIFIQFCEEVGNREFGNGANYAATCYEWAAKIEERYPQQNFHFGFFVPTLWDKENGVSEKARVWAEQIVSVKPLDKDKWFINQYCHGFNMFSFTGDVDHDAADVDHAVNVLLPEFTKTIADSVFGGMQVYIGQMSANEFAGDAYNSAKWANFQYLVNFYGRATKHFIQATLDGTVHYIGQCYIGLNSWVNKQLTPNLDFHYVSVQNNVYIQGGKGLYISGGDPDVDKWGVAKDGVYRICFQNKKGTESPLPKTISFNGQVLDFAPVKVAGFACPEKNSTTGTEHNPMEKGFLSGYGIYYFEFKIKY